MGFFKRGHFWFSLVALVFLFVACAAPTISPSTTTSPTPTTTGPKYGGTLRIAIPDTPVGLDPVILGSSTGTKALVHSYSESLTAGVGKSLFNLTYVGRLAESWEFSPDGMSLTIRIRKGVKFQNIPPVNGRELTAEDIKYNIERIKDPKTRSPQAGNLADMESFLTPDKYTLVINFRNPMPGIIHSFTGTLMNAFAREVVEQDGHLNKTFVGTGPFILKEYVAGSRGAFERNPNYWGQGLPYLDKVEYVIVPDEAQRKAAFRAGELDVCYETKVFVDSIKSSVPGAKIAEGVSYTGVALYPSIGGNPKLWGDKRVRQALQYAIDYDGLIKAVLNDGGGRSGYLAPWHKDWGAKMPNELPKRDIAKAKALLAEAGYPNGFKTTIMQDSGNTKSWGGPIEAVQSMLKEIGIDAEIIPVDSATFTANLRASKYELACGTSPTGQPGDPDTTMIVFYRSNSPQNNYKYINPKLDELIAAEQKSFLNIEARKKIFKDILTLLEDEVPVVPLYVQYSYQITQPWVNWPNSVDTQNQNGSNQLRDVWIDRK
jgi:peptide/nickel transport system substrate-binding protein